MWFYTYEAAQVKWCHRLHTLSGLVREAYMYMYVLSQESISLVPSPLSAFFTCRKRSGSLGTRLRKHNAQPKLMTLATVASEVAVLVLSLLPTSYPCLL